VDIAQNLQLLVAAESVLARALDGYALVAGPGGSDDAGPQAWYAAEVCRDHVAALEPFLDSYGQWTDVPSDGAALKTEDMVLLGSLVAMAWDLVATSAWTIDDPRLGALVDQGSQQTHAQVDWLLMRLHREVFRDANGDY